MPIGRKISSRAKITNRLPADRKNQSKVLVIAGRSQPKNAAACAWKSREHRTNRTMVTPEIRNTGLWMSSPKGVMLSCPIR